ncbi:GNAT family N-acetyltransferase [Haloprofundus salilacus]|uniref:GNAT family N-acetyltransferase n=1 Tax=Haloprofundus salilacus TaxID=2876190 RepID=UPI001CCD1B6A|nr:GNAT family N-acetyltransferase [Haloprofundus salilacus]
MNGSKTGKTGVEPVESEAAREDAFAVREAVFVNEQGVPEELEWDEHDDAVGTLQFVAYDGGEPVGAARLRRVDDDDGVRKVERVAVLEAERGNGWGKRLVEALERAASDGGVRELRLHAQTHVETFYRDLGYETTSDVFEEAGIPHVEMWKSL